MYSWADKCRGGKTVGQCCFGVDIGGTTVKIGLFDQEERPVHTWEIPTRKDDNGSHILEDIAKALEHELVIREIRPEQVLGVGLDVPGPVVDGKVIYAINLGWGYVDAAAELSAMFHDIPVKVANDANAAALGEAWFGSAKGYRNVVTLTLGTGLGQGIVLDGKVLEGCHGAAGEIAHAIFYPDAEADCNCGHRGCLEQIASATGIVNKAKQLLRDTDLHSVLREKELFSAKDVMDACKAQDPVGMQTVNTLVDYLGRAMAVIAAVLDPEAFVIGGGVSRTGNWLNELLRARMAEAAPPACRDIRVLPAALGNDAGMYGSAALILSEKK